MDKILKHMGVGFLQTFCVVNVIKLKPSVFGKFVLPPFKVGLTAEGKIYGYVGFVH